jgi:hypothetical protein
MAVRCGEPDGGLALRGRHLERSGLDHLSPRASGGRSQPGAGAAPSPRMQQRCALSLGNARGSPWVAVNGTKVSAGRAGRFAILSDADCRLLECLLA